MALRYGNTPCYLQTTHTGFSSPAAEHHHPLAGTYFTVLRRVEGWYDLQYVNKGVVDISLLPRCCSHLVNLKKITSFVHDFGPLAPLRENATSSTKPEVFKPVILSSEEDRATATGNTYRKCGKIWTCCFWDTRVDRQTNIQTCCSQYFAHVLERK